MLFEYDTLQLIWWVLVGVLLIGFALTNGLDMAVSTLLFKVGKTKAERNALVSTISPHWDGNQVWLITAGGAIFAAWPEVYAAAFSGLYFAMLLVLFAIWLRPLAFDYRNHSNDDLYVKRWDIALGIGSFIPMFIFGVAFGNLLQGLPFWVDTDARWHYEGYFLSALLPLLNPFALLCGLVSVCMLITHGAMWIQLRTVDEIAIRARSVAKFSGLTTVVLFLLAGVWSYTFDSLHVISLGDADSYNQILSKNVEVVENGLFKNYISYPIFVVFPVVAVIGMLLAAINSGKGNAKKGIIYTSLGIASTICTAACALFPIIMPSSKDPASSLTIYDATSSHFTLNVMLYAVIIFVPIALGYTIWAYAKMWNKAAPFEHNENDDY